MSKPTGGAIGWFRAKRRIGAAAALVLLLFQLAISFGHVHGVAAAAPSPVATDHAATLPDTDAPAGPPGRDDDDYCAICAVINLVGTGRIAEAPSLPVRLDFVCVRIAGVDEALVTQPASLPFRSRGPPIV